jgi:ABC-2 type transport system ATP-binding protein
VVSESKDNAIETFSLTKVFPDWWGRAKVIAVEDLNLKIKPNEVYGLLGPNGSGKTTTLKMLLSLLHPTKGKAFILGGSSRDTRISSRVGYLPEESYLYKYLSARETLDFFGRIFGLPRAVRKTRIESLLDMVGLSGMANRAVGTYSKGMARRIGLAQALINDPEVLILDEPTSGMDPLGTRQMKDLIVELASRGKTVLLCSHLLADVEDVCDRIGIMYGGRMQVEGTVGSLLKRTNTQQITTGAISESAMDNIRQIITAEQQDCNISEPMDKLEDFFIRTVTAAQKQQQPTSGAVNTARVEGFLSNKKEDETPGVLEELVAASTSQSPVDVQKVDVPAGPEETETVSTEKSELLESLTKTSLPNASEKVTTGTTPVEKPKDVDDVVRKDVLSGLMGDRSGSDATESVQPDSTGDDSDA